MIEYISFIKLIELGVLKQTKTKNICGVQQRMTQSITSFHPI